MNVTALRNQAWEWMRSDRGLMLWAVLVGIASGLLAVLMKQSVGALRSGMFAISPGWAARGFWPWDPFWGWSPRPMWFDDC